MQFKIQIYNITWKTNNAKHTGAVLSVCGVKFVSCIDTDHDSSVDENLNFNTVTEICLFIGFEYPEAQRRTVIKGTLNDEADFFPNPHCPFWIFFHLHTLSYHVRTSKQTHWRD